MLVTKEPNDNDLINYVVPEGAVALNYGVPGMGYYKVSAGDRSHGPTTSLIVWKGAHPWDMSNHALRVRTGELIGLPGIAAGSQDGIWIDGAGGRIIWSDKTASITDLKFGMFHGADKTVEIDPVTPQFRMGEHIPTGLQEGGAGCWMGKYNNPSSPDYHGKYMFRYGGTSHDGLARIIWNGINLSIRSGTTTMSLVKFDQFGDGYLKRNFTVDGHGIIKGYAVVGGAARWTSYALTVVGSMTCSSTFYARATGIVIGNFNVGATAGKSGYKMSVYGGIYTNDKLTVTKVLTVGGTSNLVGSVVVGHGTAQASHVLTVRGSGWFNNSVHVGTTLNVLSTSHLVGNVTMDHNLSVKGTSTTTGKTYCAGGLLIGSPSGILAPTVSAGTLMIDRHGGSTKASIILVSTAAGFTANAHNMAAMNAYFQIQKISGSQGGTNLISTGNGGIGMMMTASCVRQGGSTDFTYLFRSYGVHNASLAGTANMICFQNGMSSRVIIKATGAIWSKGGTTIHAFDNEDDLALLRGYSLSKLNPIQRNWGNFISSNYRRLIELDLVAEDGMVNMNGMMELQVGAIHQLNQRVVRMEQMDFITLMRLMFARVWEKVGG